MSKKFREMMEKHNIFKHDTIKYHFKDHITDRICLEVCSDCQYDCLNCGHGSFRSVYKNYHMSIDELNRFLYYTKKSNYHIRDVYLHGPGEPTLWKNLNEGLKILYESPVVGNVYIVTNGVSLNRIKEETFQYIYIVLIAVYPDAKENDLITHLCQEFPEKIKFHVESQFLSHPTKEYPNSIPCRCICPFPSVIDNKIFYCSPAIFDAAKAKGVDIFDCHEVYSELKENYLHNVSVGNFDLCKYCLLNSGIHEHLKVYDHKLFKEVKNEK
jgi:hypothetical protein